MTRAATLAVLFLLGTTGHSPAQQIDERAAQAACQDDAFRYCQGTIPDRERTLACLVQNKDGLSGGCRGVLASVFPPEKKSRSQRAKRNPSNPNSAASR